MKRLLSLALIILFGAIPATAAGWISPQASARVAGVIESVGGLFDSGAQNVGCYTVVQTAGPSGGLPGLVRVEWWNGEHNVGDLCSYVAKVGNQIDANAWLIGISCNLDACEAGRLSVHGLSLNDFKPK